MNFIIFLFCTVCGEEVMSVPSMLLYCYTFSLYSVYGRQHHKVVYSGFLLLCYFGLACCGALCCQWVGREWCHHLPYQKQYRYFMWPIVTSKNNWRSSAASISNTTATMYCNYSAVKLYHVNMSCSENVPVCWQKLIIGGNKPTLCQQQYVQVISKFHMTVIDLWRIS